MSAARLREDSLLAACLAASALLHGPLLVSFPRAHGHRPSASVEIDLTAPASRGKRTGAPAAPVRAPEESLGAAASSAQPPLPRETPEQSRAHGHGPAGEGGGGVALARSPHLLNLAELRRILERYYPEQERRQGREGMVVLDLHIDAAGAVTGVDVVRSAGRLFDEAARQVALSLRFAPAYAEGKPVAVKVRQSVVFKIER